MSHALSDTIQNSRRAVAIIGKETGVKKRSIYREIIKEYKESSKRIKQ